MTKKTPTKLHAYSSEVIGGIQAKSFVAMANDSILKKFGVKKHDTVVRHVCFGTGELPEALKPFEDKLGDFTHITIVIPRVEDENGKIIRLLPDFLVPHKRYSTDDIENALDEEALPRTTAGETTIYGWRLWWKAFIERVSEFTESLADKQKGWLGRLVLKVYGSLSPTLRCGVF